MSRRLRLSRFPKACAIWSASNFKRRRVKTTPIGRLFKRLLQVFKECIVRSLKILLLILFSLACLKLLLPVSEAQKSATPGLFAKSVQPFLAEHCYACHNSKQQAGGLNLQTYKTAASISENREVWERVMRKLQTGQMPPKGLPRPDRGALESVIRWIEQQFGRADRLAK